MHCSPPSRRSSVASEWVKGKKLDEALTIKNSDIANHLRLPPVKIHCRYAFPSLPIRSLLAEDAVKSAIHDYMKKNNLKEEDLKKSDKESESK